MSFEIITFPCLSDNYAFLVHKEGRTALVDAPEAARVLAELDKRGWSLDEIWLTHHHDDHIQAVAPLKARFPGLIVRGNSADSGRLPPLDAAFDREDHFDFAGSTVKVLFVPGHTLEHVAFYLSDANALFSADSLMALGCGRLFEGTPEQMMTSLAKMAALPVDTVVYSGHEYTEKNANFAMSVSPGNAALQARVTRVLALRAKGQPTVPTLLSDELATNPFLSVGLSHAKDALDMSGSRDIDVFAEIRRRRNSY